MGYGRLKLHTQSALLGAGEENKTRLIGILVSGHGGIGIDADPFGGQRTLQKRIHQPGVDRRQASRSQRPQEGFPSIKVQRIHRQVTAGRQKSQNIGCGLVKAR